MRALITGANGHIGCHVVRACASADITPIAFVRKGADVRGLADLDVETRNGDLLDEGSLRDAMKGVEIVFHVGAVHANFARDEASIVRPAVDGTRNVLRAARASGVRRVVYTSTGATIGFTDDPTNPLDESYSLATAQSPYVRGKIEAERVALGEADGLEVVVVNPSGVFGPRDYRVTPATRGLVGGLQGDPIFFHLSVTDVRDVADCHVRAATRGQSGRRYLATGDVVAPARTRELFRALGGVAPPTFRPPRFLASFLAGRMEKKASASGGDAPLTRAMVADVFGRHLAYDSRRARTELGASFRGAEAVLRDAFRWLVFAKALAPRVEAKVRAALGAHAAPEPDWSA